MENHPLFGGYVDVAMWSGYCLYGATQLAAEYNAINPRVAIRKYNQNRSNWGDWTEFITTANIGSQSVNYANSAGSANSVAWGNVSGKPTFATVATSGSYNDLSNKPTIPTNTNQLTNGAGFITGITKAMVTTALGYTPPTTNTTYSAATTSADGLMSKSDKSKLDGIASGATAVSSSTVSG